MSRNINIAYITLVFCFLTVFVQIQAQDKERATAIPSTFIPSVYDANIPYDAYYRDLYTSGMLKSFTYQIQEDSHFQYPSGYLRFPFFGTGQLFRTVKIPMGNNTDPSEFSGKTFDLTGKVFSGIYEIGMYGDVNEYVCNVDFSDSIFTNVMLQDYCFNNCNFSRVKFYDTAFISFMPHEDCNFEDAWINGLLFANDYLIKSEQLISTASYKAKNLSGFRNGILNGGSLAGFDLRNSCLSLTGDCDFTDALIEGASMAGASIEKLLMTRDFKQRMVKGVSLGWSEWPNYAVDLSTMVFIDCTFSINRIENPELRAKVDLTDSVISGCDFSAFQGLTLENVKSTWNYKHNRMEGIALPESIQKVLDAEKEKQ